MLVSFLKGIHLNFRVFKWSLFLLLRIIDTKRFFIVVNKIGLSGGVIISKQYRLIAAAWQVQSLRYWPVSVLSTSIHKRDCGATSQNTWVVDIAHTGWLDKVVVDFSFFLAAQLLFIDGYASYKISGGELAAAKVNKLILRWRKIGFRRCPHIYSSHAALGLSWSRSFLWKTWGFRILTLLGERFKFLGWDLQVLKLDGLSDWWMGPRWLFTLPIRFSF